MVGETSGQTATELKRILGTCRESFAAKIFEDSEARSDLLMDALSVTPGMKVKNPQYWGRELGTAWESLLKAIWVAADDHCHMPPPGDPTSPCDIVGTGFAVDAKYRIGSGDSGTLQKLARNGAKLEAAGRKPILLIFRDDSLRSSLSAAKSGGWAIYEGDETLRFVEGELGFDLRSFLLEEARR